MKIFIIFCIGILALATAKSVKPNMQSYLEQVTNAVNVTLDSIYKYNKDNTSHVDGRNAADSAFGAMFSGFGVNGSMMCLDVVFANQNMDRGSPAYGAFLWQIPLGSGAIDDNIIEFGGFAISCLLNIYGDQFPASYLEKIRPNLVAATHALIWHSYQVPIAYTNIAILNAVSSITLGEYLGNETVADYGYMRLSEWYNWTQQVGVSEYMSSTYYCVDILGMMMGNLLVKQANAKEMMKRALDMLVFDSVASYFAPVRTIAGAQSRSYYWLSTQTSLTAYLYAWGIRDTPGPVTPNDELSTTPFLYYTSTIAAEAYIPDTSLIAAANQSIREVFTTCAANPGQDRYFYITPKWGMGSSSADYNNQDKTTDVRFDSGDPDRPYNNLFVTTDDFDQPYGNVVNDMTGWKPWHLPNNPVVLQKKGVMLGTFVAHNRGQPYPTKHTLATNVIVPINATSYSLNNKSFNISNYNNQSNPGNFTIKAGDVLGLLGNDVWVGIKVMYTEACRSQDAPQLFFKTDTGGIELGSARIAIYHYLSNISIDVQCFAKSIILIVVGDVTSQSDYQSLIGNMTASSIVTNNFNNNTKVWNVTAVAFDYKFDLSRNISNPFGVIDRAINGEELVFGSYNFNGQDIGHKLLG